MFKCLQVAKGVWAWCGARKLSSIPRGRKGVRRAVITTGNVASGAPRRAQFGTGGGCITAWQERRMRTVVV